MIKMKIDARRDYELYIKHRLQKTAMTNKHKAVMRKVAMQAFDDGIAFMQGILTVEIKNV